jgi:hypothetical protein
MARRDGHHTSQPTREKYTHTQSPQARQSNTDGGDGAQRGRSAKQAEETVSVTTTSINDAHDDGAERSDLLSAAKMDGQKRVYLLADGHCVALSMASHAE